MTNLKLILRRLSKYKKDVKIAPLHALFTPILHLNEPAKKASENPHKMKNCPNNVPLFSVSQLDQKNCIFLLSLFLVFTLIFSQNLILINPFLRHLTNKIPSNIFLKFTMVGFRLFTEKCYCKSKRKLEIRSPREKSYCSLRTKKWFCNSEQ